MQILRGCSLVRKKKIQGPESQFNPLFSPGLLTETGIIVSLLAQRGHDFVREIEV